MLAIGGHRLQKIRLLEHNFAAVLWLRTMRLNAKLIAP